MESSFTSNVLNPISMRRAGTSEQGFTLMELLIVIAILAILAAGLIIGINPLAQLQKAGDARRKSDLGQVQKALEAYYNDTGTYPTNTASYQITGAVWGSSWGNYMAKVPSDPTVTKKYIYVASADQQTYWLYASLDNTHDIQLCNSGNACTNATSHSVGASCGGTCNYGVSSSNTTP